MLNQKLQQKLLQKLSPQQIQLMKLLQLPSIVLEQRVKQEIEENPALEEGMDSEELQSSEDINREEKTETQEEDSQLQNDEFDISDYLNEDDVPTYKTTTNNTSEDDEQKDIPFSFKKIFS